MSMYYISFIVNWHFTYFLTFIDPDIVRSYLTASDEHELVLNGSLDFNFHILLGFDMYLIL